jgi:DNA polymerase elongation subunit (family B)
VHKIRDTKHHAKKRCQNCEFITDIHFKDDITHIWTRNFAGEVRYHPLAFHPKIYVSSDFIPERDRQYAIPGSRVLEEVRALVMTLEDVISTKVVKRYLSSFAEELTDVLELEIFSMTKLPKVVEFLIAQRFNVFNCDINKRQHFFLDTKAYPMGACHIYMKHEQPSFVSDGNKKINEYALPKNSYELDGIVMYENLRLLDYDLPPFVVARVDLNINITGTFPAYKDILRSITITTSRFRSEDEEAVTLEGDEKQMLLGLVHYLRTVDPDFVLLQNGDKFSINYLAHRAHLHKISRQFYLGRLDIPSYPSKDGKGQVYMTYGAIMNRDPVKYIAGRIHLDYDNSFMLYEGGLEGLIDLCRISSTPPERVSRASIGTILTGAEFVVSISTVPPTLVPPNKPIGEQYKPSDLLLIADNGGLTYPALPGVYDKVWAIDFTSLYPMIMLKHNIGNETVLCHHEDCKGKNVVPEVGYHICEKNVGVVPRTMKLILEKRVRLKLAKSYAKSEKDRERYAGIDSAFKWILVCCLEGSTRVLVRRNGKVLTDRIDTIVNEFTEEDTLEALGIDEFGQPEFKPVKNVIKTRPRIPVYRIEFRGGKKITATGDHLWPVMTSNGWKNVRTDQLTNDDRIPQLDKFDQENQHELLKNVKQLAPISFTRVVGVSQLETSPEYVYCFELDSPTPWFMIEGNLITHNCFGYLGYKNSRWGSIESHQCVTAFARRYLLEARQICEKHGYEVICGIVDSLFIRKLDQTDDHDIDALIYDISKNAGIPMDTEGKFQWVVFCNIKEFTDVAALNRYFGYFEHGEFKLRGIRTRQRRVTSVEREFQREILEHLKQARSVEEFEELIPACYDILRRWQQRLSDRDVNARDLIIKIKSHVGVGNYKSRTQQALVAQAYQRGGKTIEAGQSMYYIVRDDRRRDSSRVTIGPNVRENSRYDINWYCDLLEDALLEIVEAPQRQFYGEIKYTSDGYINKLDEWEEKTQHFEPKLVQREPVALSSGDLLGYFEEEE